MYGEKRGVFKVLVGKPEGKRPLGRTRRRWKDNIKMDLQEVGWGHGMDLYGSGQGQMASTCEFGNNISRSIKFGEYRD